MAWRQSAERVGVRELRVSFRTERTRDFFIISPMRSRSLSVTFGAALKSVAYLEGGEVS